MSMIILFLTITINTEYEYNGDFRFRELANRLQNLKERMILTLLWHSKGNKSIITASFK